MQEQELTELRNLVAKWREGAGPGNGNFYLGVDSGLDRAADDLEDYLLNNNNTEVK